MSSQQNTFSKNVDFIIRGKKMINYSKIKERNYEDTDTIT